MQLLVAIVQADDADVLIARLIEQGYRVTRIDSVGGFLARGNATVLIGLDDDQVDEVLALMRMVCRTRAGYIVALPTPEAAGALSTAAMPLEVRIGGAVVFSFPVQRFLRVLGGTASAVADQPHPALVQSGVDVTNEKRGGRMNLVLVIVQNNIAEQVAGGLLAAGYRVTRLNTAGGFLRRSNVTFLIGVESAKVDDVLAIIQANTEPRTEARPLDAGMPAYGATIFVLEADRFVRM